MKPGERLVQVAKEKGITQKELAKKLNVSASTVSDWANGKTDPKGPNLIKAAEIIGVSVDFLAGGQDVITGNVHTNNGIIGHAHAPVTIVNGSKKILTANEIELLHIFSELNAIEQAKVLIFANELKEKTEKTKKDR
jgi:transcriptional regulator with XRE-family HTH domain